MQGRVEMFSGEISELVKNLESEGFNHAYIDGGATITSFLNLQLINKMTITKAPVLLGAGISLFGKMDRLIKLNQSKATAFPNDFVQIHYDVSYS